MDADTEKRTRGFSPKDPLSGVWRVRSAVPIEQFERHCATQVFQSERTKQRRTPSMRGFRMRLNLIAELIGLMQRLPIHIEHLFE